MVDPSLIFLGVPHLATCIFLFFYNEPELGVGIDPGVALTPLPNSHLCHFHLALDRDRTHNHNSSQSEDCELSALPLDHSIPSPTLILMRKDLKNET